MVSVLWFQGGAGDANTVSRLTADEPNVADLIVDFGLDLLWHPSFGLEPGRTAQKLFDDCARGDRPLDIFVFEGTVAEGSYGTGRMDVFAGRPVKDWVTDLAAQAQIAVAIGDRADRGGASATAPDPSGSTGPQFHRSDRGGFPGPDFRSRSGLPAINVPDRPAHPDRITRILVALATGRAADIALDELHRPETFFESFARTDRTRVQSAEGEAVATTSFGEGTRTGCLFYEFGCRGPMTHSPCNRILWNRQSSQARAGMPGAGCTEPEFPFFDPAPGTVFKTQKISGVIPSEWSEKDLLVV
jgi:uptake hydrogenase small subunit